MPSKKTSSTPTTPAAAKKGTSSNAAGKKHAAAAPGTLATPTANTGLRGLAELFGDSPPCVNGSAVTSITEFQKVIHERFGKEVSRENEKFLVFLLAKNVMAGDPLKWDRFKGLLGLAQQSESASKFYAPARTRLRQILVPGDFTAPVLPGHVQSFEAFCALPNMEAWGNSDKSRVFWRDSLGSSQPVQRVQRSRLCYFHAPDVLQHYLVARHVHAEGGDVENVPMIDMSKYIRRCFSADSLAEHIFLNKGGSAKDMLGHILEPGKNGLVSFSCVFGQQHFVSSFNMYGPAMIARFKVSEEFKSDAGPFVGSHPPPANAGRHAMLIVGYRHDESNELRLLVQNWWAAKQFVEMDLAFLKACDAEIVFAESAQTQIPHEFPREVCVFAENEHGEMPDGYELDGSQ